MSDIDKTIKILEKVPASVSSKITMRNISEILSIMFNIHDEENFEPTIEDFEEALAIRLAIEDGFNDVKNGNVYTSEEVKKELNLC